MAVRHFIVSMLLSMSVGIMTAHAQTAGVQVNLGPWAGGPVPATTMFFGGSGSTQITLGGADYPNSDPNIGDTYSFDYLNQTIGSSFDKYNATGVAGITREMDLTSSGGFIIPIYGIATISATSPGGYAQAFSASMEFTSTGVGAGSALTANIFNENPSVVQGYAFECGNSGNYEGEACFHFYNYGVPVYNVEFFDPQYGTVGSNAMFSDTKGTSVAPVVTPYGTQWSGNTTFSGAEYTSPGFLIGPTVASYNSRVEVLGGAGTAGPTIGVAGSGNGALGAGTNGATPATNAPLNVQALGTGAIIFKSHLSATGTAPALTACGTSPTIDATASDAAGTITEGTSATGCTATFHAAYASAPHCVVSSPSGAALTSYSATTTALTLVNGSPAEFTYVCMQ